MYVQLIEVPYDSGHWGTRMGRGPGAIAAAGLASLLRAAGHATESERLGIAAPFPTETATAFQLGRALAERVRAAAWHSRLPLVLAGNCMSCLGVLAGLRAADIGIVWMDAHGDFNTPETTASGFLDGMALSVATGRCWRRMSRGVPGFRPVDPRRVVLVGARDVDPPEAAELREAGVAWVPPTQLQRELPAALNRLREEVSEVYLHFDLDVLDPEEGRANGYAAPGGLSLAQALDAIRTVQERFRVRAATLSAYDPAYDPDGRARAAALQVCAALAAAPEAAAKPGAR